MGSLNPLYIPLGAGGVNGLETGCFFDLDCLSAGVMVTLCVS